MDHGDGVVGTGRGPDGHVEMFENVGEEDSCMGSKNYFTPVDSNIRLKRFRNHDRMLAKKFSFKGMSQSMQNGPVEVQNQKSTGHVLPFGCTGGLNDRRK